MGNLNPELKELPKTFNFAKIYESTTDESAGEFPNKSIKTSSNIFNDYLTLSESGD